MEVADVYDDGAHMAAAMAANNKPFLTKEIYTRFSDFPGLSSFLREFYAKAYAGGGAGVIVQHVPLVKSDNRFQISWLSESGEGNRDREPSMDRENLPNWCDPSQAVWSPTNYSRLFAELSAKYMNVSPVARAAHPRGEILISGLTPNSIVFLLPRTKGRADGAGMRAAEDGTAWMTLLVPGDYDLYCTNGFTQVKVIPQQLATDPGSGGAGSGGAGYGSVQRVDAPHQSMEG